MPAKGHINLSGQVASALLLLGYVPAAAQVTPPPASSTSSPEGVNYRNGSFSHSETDLSIGGAGAAGLSLTRTYMSSIDAPSDLFVAASGWTHSLQGYVTTAKDPLPPWDPGYQPGEEPHTYSVSMGGRSATFGGGSEYIPNVTTTGGPVGTYWPISTGNTQLIFNGTTGAGYYTFIDRDGTVMNFTTGAGGYVSNMTMPDGTVWTWTYNSSMRIESVFSNRGWAILFDADTACAVNTATTYVTATSPCPAGVQTISYGYTAGVYNTGARLLTSATKAGQATTYTYTGSDKLGCIKEPGQSVCSIQNTYYACPRDPGSGSPIQPYVRIKDPVISQVDASGRSITYGYAIGYEPASGNVHGAPCNYYGPEQNGWPFVNSRTDVHINGVPRSYLTVPGGESLTVTDEIGRVTKLGFEGGGQLTGAVYAEGNAMTVVKDGQGNPIGQKLSPKPTSGLSIAETTASYPSSCANPKVCGKPSSVTDARGNTTSYTYSNDHGGVLTETGPALGGVQPVKRYAYAQHYAWLRASSGGYAQAASPVWLVSEERTCRTSATVGNACAAGTADEVVVSYQYEAGNASTPSNLLLKGKAVTADGQTLRTCYGYDGEGNRIWETSPRAGLATCA